MHMKINNREIGTNFPPYIIAEMSANHNGDIENAYKIIYEATLPLMLGKGDW